MTSLLATGVFVLAFVAGHWTLGWLHWPSLRQSALASHSLAVVLGVAFLTPPLVVLAAAGDFQIAWLGAFCWIAAIACLARGPMFWRINQRPDVVEVIVLIAAITFVIVAAFGRDEALGAGRDQQAYAEAAVALSERGHPRAIFSPLDDADRTLLRSVSGVVVPDVVDLHPDANQSMSLTHPLGWSVWLAVAHAVFGIEGVYAANSVVFALGGLLFFVLLRCIVQPSVALAASVLLFLLPSSIWIAGSSLSEPLAMMLLLAVPLFAAEGTQRSVWPIAAILTAATLVRIDAALGVPATIAAAILTGGAASTDKQLVAIRRFALIQLLAHFLSLLAYCTLFPQFLRDLSGYVTFMCATATALTLATWFITKRTVLHLRRLVDSKTFRLTVIAGLICFFLYAVEVRPTLEPFSMIQRGLPGLDGTRDFREDSLLNLATYISWPSLLMALAGVCYGIWNRWLVRGDLLLPLLLTLGLVPALLYLWFPHVTPDHPWAFRRFITTIVPYSLLFAAVFVRALASRIGRTGPALGALILVAPYSLIISNFGTQRLLFRENDGMTEQIAAIAKELPNSLIVATGVDQNVAAALLVAYGKPVAFINDDLSQTDDFMHVSDWIDAKAKLGHPAWLLHGPEFWTTGANLALQRKWRMTRSLIKPYDHPPATAIVTQTSHIMLTRANGLDLSFAMRMFGGERAWGAPGRHFFATEVAPFGAFRYTDGFAWIDVPTNALRHAEALKVDVFSYARAGERRWLHVLLNEQRIWDGSVDAGVSTLRIPIPESLTGNTARITLLSQEIGRNELNKEDPRIDLSIGLIGIRPLLPGEPRSSGPAMDGFRSNLTIERVPIDSFHVSTKSVGHFILGIRNTGTAFWPTVRELGEATGAVQVALRWYRRESPEAFVGDNRWPMSISMLPGDQTRVDIPLSPMGLDRKPLPPGEYVVRIGMVRETVALFAQNGDTILSIPVVVTQ